MSQTARLNRLLKSSLAEPIFPRVSPIDHAALDRLEANVRQARAEMGEERWAQLNAEWGRDQ